MAVPENEDKKEVDELEALDALDKEASEYKKVRDPLPTKPPRN